MHDGDSKETKDGARQQRRLRADVGKAAKNSPITAIHETCQRVIPRQESSQETEESSSFDDRLPKGPVTVRMKISDPQKEKGYVQEEEEQKECHG